MNSKILALAIAALGFASATPVHAQSIFPEGLRSFFSKTTPTPAPTPTIYDTLANRRSVVVLPTYSADQKQKIADQAEYFIENYYVHQSLKKEAFGVDAVAELKAIQPVAATLGDADLHAKIQSVFSRLRDLHTTYSFPKPFACYTSILPFVLEEALDANGVDVFAVTGLVRNPEMVALSPQVAQISFGDALISFNGLDPNVVLQDYYEVGAGANPYAQKRDAMAALTSRDHANSFLPVNDSEHLVFKKLDGSTYAVDLSWISIANNDCLNPATVAPTQKDGTPVKLDKNIFLQGINWGPKPFKDTLNAATMDTADDTIHYQVLGDAEGSFGVLRLDSFMPKNIGQSIGIISDLLQNQLAATHGLVIDLRGNPGGNFSYGEMLLQLFTPKKVKTIDFKMLASVANQSFLQATGIDPTFLGLVNQAITSGQALTDGAELTPIVAANSLGQAYTKPVIVLVDSACFSTCDIFTARMQDNGIATVISTDGSTGGGGANVMVYSDFKKVLKTLAPPGVTNPFSDLPGGQEMRLAWRQVYRVGLNAGKLIENTGVIADQTVKLKLQDLILRDSALFENLTHQLATQYEASSKSSVVLNADARIDFQDGVPFTIPLKVSGTSSIELRAGGVAFASAKLNAESAAIVSTGITIPTAQLTALPDLSTIEIYGMMNLPTGENQMVWRKVVSLRRIPAAKINGTLQMNFSGSTAAPFKFYQEGTSAGWTVANHVLRIGEGPEYANNTHAEASLFVKMPSAQKLALSYTSELHSEKGFDFFSVSVFVDGKQRVIAAPASGNVSKATVVADLSAFAGKSIEIRFTFDSDQGMNGIGPVISALSLEPAHR